MKKLIISVTVLSFITFSPAIVFSYPCIMSEIWETVFPPNDRPSPEVAETLGKCSSVEFYYGINIPVDFVKARYCAFLEMDRDDDAILGGSALLMMIYANGKGVNRNLDIANKLVCLFKGKVIEINLMRDALEQLEKGNLEYDDFDVCNYAYPTSSTALACTVLDNNIKEIKRKEKLSDLMKHWSKKDRKAFDILKKTLHSFIDARTENEVDCSGTLCSIISIKAHADSRDDLLSDLDKFEHGQFPQFSLQQFAEADRELNISYSKIDRDMTIFEGIKKTQRAWLKYRDAWVLFGRQRYPSVTAESWKTWLTEKRIKMLQEFF